jgi:hypothetical protein
MCDRWLKHGPHTHSSLMLSLIILLTPSLFEQRRVTVFIIIRFHGPYQESLVEKDSQNHLVFPISGILTRFKGGATHVSTYLCLGGDSIFLPPTFLPWLQSTSRTCHVIQPENRALLAC